MEREDDQELWDFLGRTAEPRLSPFFARNVLRKIRQGASRFGRTRNWFSLRRLVAASAVVILVIGMAIATRHPVPQKSPESAPDVVSKIDSQYYDVFSDLEDMISWVAYSRYEDMP